MISESIKLEARLLLIAVVLFLCTMCKHDTTDIISSTVDTTHHSVGPINLLDSVCYAEMVEPILLSNCARSGCHNDTTVQKGISVASYARLMQTISGELLLQSITDTGEAVMPPSPNQKLDSSQIAIIRQWVKEGMKNNIDCEGPCDTLTVTYSGTIVPLLKNNCNGCHNNSTPILTNFDSVKVQVNNGKLYGSVIHASGIRAMPDNLPKLRDCKIIQLRKWIDAGANNN